MGLLLSVLFSYVGAIEIIFIARDIVHQVGLHHEQMKITKSTSNASSRGSPVSSAVTLADLQDNLRKSLKSAEEHLCESEQVHSMADGIQYEEGYRVLSANEEELSKRWLQARANVTDATPPNSEHDAINSFQTTVNVTKINTEFNKSDDAPSEDERGSSISVETVVENESFHKLNDNDRTTTTHFDNKQQNRSNDFPIGNANEHTEYTDNDDDVPDIHFDEYSQAYLHALDGIKSKSVRKGDDVRRRKGFKHQTSNSNELLQRRRSEDIDGETDNPWGELKLESFHDSELWQRERAMSIQENDQTEDDNAVPIKNVDARSKRQIDFGKAINVNVSNYLSFCSYLK